MKHVLVICAHKKPQQRTEHLVSKLFGADPVRYHLMGNEDESVPCLRDAIRQAWDCPGMPPKVDMVMFEGCPRYDGIDVVVPSTLQKAHDVLVKHGTLVVDRPGIKIRGSNATSARQAQDLTRYGFKYLDTVTYRDWTSHEMGVYMRTNLLGSQGRARTDAADRARRFIDERILLGRPRVRR